MYSIYPLTVVPLSVSFLNPPACLPAFFMIIHP